MEMEKEMAQSITFVEKDTIRPADCVESCPVDGATDLMICGTYHLQQQSQSSLTEDEEVCSKENVSQDSRAGNFHVYQLESTAPDGDESVLEVNLRSLQVDELDTGIFDMKWSHHRVEGAIVMAIATANGDLRCFKVDEETKTLVPTVKKEYPPKEESDGMFLSLDWNNRVRSGMDPKIAVSQSNGDLSVWAYGNGDVVEECTWKAHNLFGVDIEVWITAFNHFNPSVIFSGGDDAILKGWDIRMAPETSRPIFVNKNCHSMGVCSIQFHPFKEHIVATGSYDECINIWDDRNMKTPLSSYSAGGGVWRLKWHPKEIHSSYLAAACMHNGFQIINTNLSTSAEGEEINSSLPYCHTEYKKQTSLGYGIDWWYNYDVLHSSKAVIGSGSFYDHSFHLWTTNKSLD